MPQTCGSCEAEPESKALIGQFKYLFMKLYESEIEDSTVNST